MRSKPFILLLSGGALLPSLPIDTQEIIVSAASLALDCSSASYAASQRAVEESAPSRPPPMQMGGGGGAGINLSQWLSEEEAESAAAGR